MRARVAVPYLSVSSAHAATRANGVRIAEQKVLLTLSVFACLCRFVYLDATCVSFVHGLYSESHFAGPFG
jgi:hypothetical protein